MTDDLVVRPWQPGDADATAALAARYFAPDPPWTATEALERLTADALGGGAQVRTVTRGDRVVGVGGFVRAAPWLYLWPVAADDEEAAGALLDALVAAGRGPGITTARVSTRTVEPHKRAAVAARGYARSIDFVAVGRPTAPPLAAPAVAASPRRGDAIDRAAMHDLHERCFATIANTAPMSRADFDEYFTASTAWAPGTAAWHDGAGACVGFTIGVRAPDHRVVEAIGVDPSWRGRGLGLAMLADLVAAAAAEVAEVRALIASTNGASLALHARAGFVEQARKELWDLALPSAL